MITAERLRELIHYDPDTGVFRWAVPRFGASLARRVGCANERGYIKVCVEYKRYYAHRLAWLYMTGEWPPHDVDHINQDKGDNRFVNLRLATRSQNIVNSPSRKDSKTGLKGVYKLPGGRFRAVLNINGKPCHLGTFATAEEASEARIVAAERIYGEYYCPA